MKKWFKASFWYILAIGALFVSAGYLFVLVYGEDLKDVLVKQMNRNLTREIKVQEVRVSPFSHFPYISVHLEGIRIFNEPGDPASGYVAKLGKVDMMLDLVKVFKKNYVVENILVENGVLNLKVNKQGEKNYIIWKTPEEKPTGEQLKLDLNKIKVKNVKLTYKDVKKEQDLTAFFEEGSLTGRLSGQKFSLNAGFKGLLDHYTINEVSYLKNKLVELDTRLSVNKRTGLFKFEKGDLVIAGAEFDLTGQLLDKPKGLSMDLEIRGKENEFNTLLALIPEKFRKYLTAYSGEGDITFQAVINGILSGQSNPLVKVDFGVRNGRLKRENVDAVLKHINLEGKFTNGYRRSLKTSLLSLIGINLQLEGKEVRGNLKLNNFTNPYLNFDIVSRMDPGKIARFLKMPGLKKAGGAMFIDASFAGRLKDLEQVSTIHKTSIRGKLSLTEVALIPESSPYSFRDLGGSFRFNGNDLLINNFKGFIAGNDFHLNGKFRNVTSFLFLKGKKLEVAADFHSRHLNLRPFLKTRYDRKREDSVSSFVLPGYLSLDLDMACDELEYGRFHARNVAGKVQYKNSVMDLRNLDLHTMEGRIRLDGKLTGNRKGNLNASLEARCSRINIHQLFYQFANFGQSFFTYDHMNGIVDARVKLQSVWDKNLNAKLDKLKVKVGLTISDGELKDFEPIEQLAGFVRINKLKHLKFEKMENEVIIKDQTVHIPEMDIHSNAFDMAISGKHTFENMVDYHFRINVSELLFGKRESYENEFGKVEYDQRGNMNLFVVMSGKGDDPDFRYDKKAVKKNIARSIRKEGREFKDAVKNDKDKKVDKYELIWDK